MFAKKIPGGWITILVGGAVFVYIIGNANYSPALTNFKDETIGLGEKKLPGGFLGTLSLLSVAGAFLNRETIGKLT